MREYASIQKWFDSKTYTPKTQRKYLEYMENIFCDLLKMNPDQLAAVSAYEAAQIQAKLIRLMTDEFKTYVIHARICVLHSFWKANGVTLTRDIISCKGTPIFRQRVKRQTL